MASPKELEALVLENQRLRAELERLAKPSLFRPPWQPWPSEEPSARLSFEVSPEAGAPIPVRKSASSPKGGLAELRRLLGSKGPAEAYELLDVNKTGQLSLVALQDGLEAMGINPSLAAEVFMALEVEGEMELTKLLDLHPLQQAQLQSMDTQSLWKAYKNKTTAHGALRPPRWKLERQSGDYLGHQETLRRRRDLRKQFREDRQGITAEQKRGLIPGARQLDAGLRESEQRSMEVHRQRIQDAIRGCSRARYSLVEIQKQMADLIGDGDKEKEVTFAFKDLFRSNVEQRASRKSFSSRKSLASDGTRKSMVFGRPNTHEDLIT